MPGAWTLFKMIAPPVLAAVVAAAAWHHMPVVGPGARIKALRADVTQLESDLERSEFAKGLTAAALATSERLRLEEGDREAVDLDAALRQCTTRVERALSDSALIDSLINREVDYGPDGCPVFGVIPADELRALTDP